jgi:hypothetical protein
VRHPPILSWHFEPHGIFGLTCLGHVCDLATLWYSFPRFTSALIPICLFETLEMLILAAFFSSLSKISLSRHATGAIVYMAFSRTSKIPPWQLSNELSSDWYFERLEIAPLLRHLPSRATISTLESLTLVARHWRRHVHDISTISKLHLRHLPEQLLPDWYIERLESTTSVTGFSGGAESLPW